MALRNISSRNRGKIRKAEKNKINFHSGLRHLDDFYNIFSINMNRLGTPVYPKSFFKNIIKTFYDNIEILVLKKDNKIIACMFLFKFKNIISEFWVASLEQYNRIYVNNLLYWKAINYACENNYEWFDFGRSTKNSGTYRFKVQWRAIPLQLYYMYIFNKTNKMPQVDSINNRYEVFINLWKKLPYRITNCLGPKVVKYLPEL